jgi:hypothetical protein
MIVQGLLTAQVISESIELPASMLGIMSIDNNSFLYATVVSANQANDATIFLSKINPDHWGDIWRCEFDFYDELGIFEKFCGLMRQNGIPILSSETSTSDVGGYHTLSSLLDFHYYFDSISKASRDRIEMRAAMVGDIEALLLIEFIDRLHLRDDNLPRLRLKRVEEYRRIYGKVLVKEVPFPVRTRVSGGRLLIDGLINLDRNLFQNINSKKYFVLPIADSKDRLLRIHLHGEDRKLNHVKFVVRDTPSGVHGLFKLIKEAGWNCDHIKLHKGQYGSLISETDAATDQYVTLDVVLRNTSAGNASTLDALLSIVKSDDELAKSGVRFQVCLS